MLRFVIELPSILLLSREIHQTYPVATGHVHIQSGTNAYAPLAFHPGYLDESVIPRLSMIRPLIPSRCNRAADLERWGYKHARELARRMAVYRGEFNIGHPAFPKDSQVKNNEVATPVDATAPKIEYTFEDEKAIDDYHRQNGT